jgi:hypothetical protein
MLHITTATGIFANLGMGFWSFSVWLMIVGIQQGHYLRADCFKIFKSTTPTDLTVTVTGLDEASIYFLSNLIILNESFVVNSNNPPSVISRLKGKMMTTHNAPLLLGENYEIHTNLNPSQILLFVFNADEIGGRIKLNDVEAFLKIKETNDLSRFRLVFLINYGKYYNFTDQERSEYQNDTITYVNHLFHWIDPDTPPFFFEGYFPNNFQQKIRYLPFRDELVRTLISIAKFPIQQFHQRNSEL